MRKPVLCIFVVMHFLPVELVQQFLFSTTVVSSPPIPGRESLRKLRLVITRLLRAAAGTACKTRCPCSDLAEAPLLSRTSSRPLALDPVDSCRILGLCHTPLHGPDSSWDCCRVLHKTPPRELDRHDLSGRGLHSSRCTRLNCAVLCIAQLCVLFTLNFCKASTESAWTKSDVISQAMHVVSLLGNCSLVSNSEVSLLTKSRSILELSQELRLLLTCCEQASKLQSSVSHFRHGCTTSTSTTQSKNCTCRTYTVSCTVWIGTWSCIATGTSTIRSMIRVVIRFW